MKTSSHIGHITELLDLVQQSDIPADRIVARFFLQRRYLGSRDRRIISETIYSIFRYAYRCERLIGETLRCLDIAPPPVYPKVWLVAVHAVDMLENPPEKVVDDIGAQWNSAEPRIDPLLFARAAASLKEFRFVGDDPVERCSVLTSFPRWMVESWIEQFGYDAAERLCRSLNQQAPLTIRVNTLVTDVPGCEKRLSEEGIASARTRLSPFGLTIAQRTNFTAHASFREGWYEVQDEGSQIVSLIANPIPGSAVIDACAGGGGKTLHMAALMKNMGTITALDIGEERLRQLEHRAERAGVSILASRVVGESAPVGDDLLGSADVVVIDAPCSGTGTIRRNPLLKWRVKPGDPAKHAARQKELLRSYSRCAKEGGLVCYATCSLFPAENEKVIEDFLEKNSDFTLQDPKPLLERWGIEWPGREPTVRLLPSMQGTDGFFIAVMKRRG